MKLVSVFLCSLFSLSAFADVWVSNNYQDYTILADKGEVYFRFSGEATYSVCATDVMFDESLVKIQDGVRHKEYLLKATTKETGDSGKCNTATVTPMVAFKAIHTKWYKLSANNSVTIIVPSWVTIELK